MIAHKKITCLLDGVETPIICADAAEGWVERHVRTPDGKYATVTDEAGKKKLVNERVYGRV